MSEKSDDPVVMAFVANYGIMNLLQDVGATKLQKTGKDQVVGTCPFHEDSTPSFSMNLVNGLFKCFACDVSGNLYKFIKMSYNLDYQGAQKYILTRAGLTEDFNVEDAVFLRKMHTILDVDDKPNEAEQPGSPKFTDAKIKPLYEKPDPHNYLQNRGFSIDTIQHFECGFTTKWRVLDQDTGKMLHEERVVIPGHDEFGEIIGFIGRTPVNDEPKYRYTYRYPKQQTLFNLHRAKHHSDHGLIVVEGSLDTMKMHNFGHPNTVGILGASLSEQQIILFGKYTDKLFVMFDSDKAGQKATMKTIEALHNTLDIYYVSLENYKDPGEIPDVITSNRLLTNAKSWFSFNINT